jgi:succinate dehydrogenase/fumarate reductase flavoprotein subunit
MNGKEYKAPSVIIATGGYGYSEKWLKEFNFTNITSNDPNTAIGSGYDFARSAGAALDNMDYCSCYGGSVPVSGFQASLRCNINYNGAIWVNTSGERLFNEPVASSMDKRTVWRTTDQNIVYIIVSEKMISDDKPLFSGMMSNSKPFDNKEKLNELLSEGKYAFKADTISELSKMINTKNLVNTVTKYNSDIASGKDTVFGRTKNLLTFDKGPYYAIYTVPYLMMTAGGPRINADGQLMRADGSKVGNCYLAGEIIGSANVAGHNTIGGIGHSLCTTWGRISAESAVKNSLVLKK